MQPGKTIIPIFFLYTFILFCTASCTTKTKTGSEDELSQTRRELAIVDSLLRDEAFAQSMAKALDSSYYIGVGQTPAPFLTAEEDTAIVSKRFKDEKIATSLAGFYALESGIGLLSAQTNQTPVEWLKNITNGSADTNAVFLLNRFANATWKAGQPFRGLSRITRYNFTVAGSLSADEIKKDAIQIRNAASKLLSSMVPISDSSLAAQMKALDRLMKDTTYATEMAFFLDSSYAVSQKQTPVPFSNFANDTATVRKSVKETKIATSIAGFYALECSLNYLVSTKHELPSKILGSLLNDSLNKEDKMIFARFANATWKAGQPFRGLNRISRPTFTPFYFLSEADIDKDMVQIKAAAKRLISFFR